MDDEKFWTLWAGVILGAEGEEDGSDDADGDDDSNDGDDSDDEPNDDGADPEKVSKEDFEKIRKALDAERRLSKKLDRENRRLKTTKTAEANEEQQTIESAQNREREAIARAEKLAAGLLQRDINAAIRDAARKANFLDPEDAISGVDRTVIEAEQDDEDPTEIYIDEESVTKAVKALAAKKPHYLSRGTEDGNPTGSAFGGKKNKSKKSEEESLRELYPSL